MLMPEMCLTLHLRREKLKKGDEDSNAPPRIDRLVTSPSVQSQAPGAGTDEGFGGAVLSYSTHGGRPVTFEGVSARCDLPVPRPVGGQLIDAGLLTADPRPNTKVHQRSYGCSRKTAARSCQCR